MDTGTRGELLGRLAGAIEATRATHPLRVAVDGPPAAGKTTLADELAQVLRGRGREVIRATTESFHHPRARRYRRGEFSPEANYHDAFDDDALRRVLLGPLARAATGATSPRSTTSAPTPRGRRPRRPPPRTRCCCSTACSCCGRNWPAGGT